jgi:hypothetical protein
MYPQSLMRSVYMLCFKHHGSVTSWGRTAKHNKEVGGVPNSYHLLWLGCDIVLDDMRQNTDFENDAIFFCLKPILEGDHYHLQPK